MHRRRVAASAVIAAGALVGTGGVVLHRGTAPHTVEVAGSPLRFDLPRDWKDTARVQDPTQAWVVQAAEQQGFTPQEYVQRLAASTRATTVGPPTGSRLQMVDVQDSGFASLPSAAAVRSRLEGLHEQVVASRTVPTAVGTAVVTRYQVPLGTETIAGDVVYVAVSGEVLAITVSAARPDVLTPLTDQVLRSLRTG
ncbi:MAG: hypothetical protein WB473_03830 [Pedococcus sp.]